MAKAAAPAPAAGAPEGGRAAERRGGSAAARRKDKRTVPHGVANIQASFNNTVITICDPDGNVITWSSAGRAGFKGSRKGTPFAAQMAAQSAGHQARDFGVRTVDVLVRGPGAGRESAIRALQTTGIDVKSIRDVTPIPHNGCRPPKRRRV